MPWRMAKRDVLWDAQVLEVQQHGLGGAAPGPPGHSTERERPHGVAVLHAHVLCTAARPGGPRSAWSIERAGGGVAEARGPERDSGC